MGIVKNIRSVFDETRTDKGYYHEYEYMYGMLFHNFTPSSILEIGVKNGRSIRAWKKLFPQAKLTGLDIKSSSLVTDDPELADFEYVIGSSTDPKVAAKLDYYDVIIDDGSHFFLDQITTFLNFKDSFKYFYVIEDINFVHNNDADPSYTLQAIKHVLNREGFKGVSVYDSVNTRKATKSLVIQSFNF